MTGMVLHRFSVKPFFQEFHVGGIVSFAAAHSYVFRFQEAVRSWVLDPKLALLYEAKGMAIVENSTFVAHLVEIPTHRFPCHVREVRKVYYWL